MMIVNKNDGAKIAHQETGTQVTLGDDELMLNLASYQRDWPVHIDICSNHDKQLVIGTGNGLYYVAQFDIPAITYTDPETEEELPTRIPLNMDDVVMTLWSLEDPASVA